MTRSVAIGACVCALAGCSSTKSGNAVMPLAPTTLSIREIAVVGDATAALNLGDTRQFVATAALSDGTVQDVTGLATWTSDAAATATVIAGLVRGVTPGTATVGIRYRDVAKAFSLRVAGGGSDQDSSGGSTGGGTTPGSGGSSGSGAGSGSSSSSSASSIEFTGSPVLGLGDRSSIKVIATMNDGSRRDVTGDATFASSNPAVAAISKSGEISAQGIGTAFVTARYGDRSASTPVIVLPRV